MYFSEKIRKAILIANQGHNNTYRKSPPKVPFITHPLTLSMILARIYPRNEDLLVAAILHDVVEDSEGENKVSIDDVILIFGQRVGSIVKSVTQDMTKSWEERKKESIKAMNSMDHETLLLKSADMLCNISDLGYSLETYGSKALTEFSRSIDIMIEDYNERIETFQKVWSDNPLLLELIEANNKLKEIQKSKKKKV